MEGVLRWRDYTTVLGHIDRAMTKLCNHLQRDRGVTVNAVMDDYFTRGDTVFLEGMVLAGYMLEHMALTRDGADTMAALLGDDKSFVSKYLAQDFKQKALNAKELAGHAGKFLGAFTDLASTMKEAPEKIRAFLAGIVEIVTSEQYTVVFEEYDIRDLLGGMGTTQPIRSLRQQFIWQLEQRTTARLWMFAPVGGQPIQPAIGRSLAWLKQNQPLIQTGLIRFSAVMETMNLVQAVSAFQEDKSTANLTKMAGSTFGLIGVYLEYLKDIRKVAGDWDTLHGKERITSRKLRMKVAVSAHGASFIGNAIALVMGFRDALTAWKQGREDSAVALGVGTLGNAALTVAGVMQAAVELQELRYAGMGAATVTRVAQWGGTEIALTRAGLALTVARLTNFIGLATVVIGFVWGTMTAKTPLEEWLFHGPFGRRKDLRYLPEEKEGTKEWASWRNDAVAENAMNNLLFGFGLAYRHEATHNAQGKRGIKFTLRVTLSQFAMGKSILNHELNHLSWVFDEHMRTAGEQERHALDAPCTRTVKNGEDGLTEVHIEYPFLPYTGAGSLEALVLLDLNADKKMLFPSRMALPKESETVAPKMIAEPARFVVSLDPSRAQLRDSGWVS